MLGRRIFITLFAGSALFAVLSLFTLKNQEPEVTETQIVYAVAAESDGRFDSRYVYNTLNSTEKELYRIIYDTLQSFEPSDAILYGSGDVQRVYDYVSLDSPELFYVTGIKIVKHTSSDAEYLTIEGDYSMTENEADRARQDISEEVSSFLSTIPSNASDYDRVKLAYEYVASVTDYVPGAPFNQSIYSVFIGRKSVCMGYAKAFQYLMYEQGIPCILVTGVTGEYNASHAWDMVRVDGDYYHVDPTWGDMYGSGVMSYDFLLVDDATVSMNHRILSDIEYPACTSMRLNYYVVNGTYITDKNTEHIGSLLSDIGNSEEVTLKFATNSLMQFYEQYLIQEKNMFQWMSGEVNYIINREMLTMTITKGR